MNIDNEMFGINIVLKLLHTKFEAFSRLKVCQGRMYVLPAPQASTAIFELYIAIYAILCSRIF